MRALLTTHCILLALATGMLASSSSAATPAPTNAGLQGTTATNTASGCPVSASSSTKGRSSGYVGFQLDDSIQSGTSCAWSIEAPTTATSGGAYVIVAKRVQDFSANSKITASMFNTTLVVGGNSSANSSSLSSSKSSKESESDMDSSKPSNSASTSKSIDRLLRRRRQDVVDGDDETDGEESSKSSSKSSSHSSKHSEATGGSSKHSSKSASKKLDFSGSDSDDNDDKESSKSNSKSSKKSSGVPTASNDDDKDEESESKSHSSGKSSSKSASSSSKNTDAPAQNTDAPATSVPSTAVPTTGVPATSSPATAAPTQNTEAPAVYSSFDSSKNSGAFSDVVSSNAAAPVDNNGAKNNNGPAQRETVVPVTSSTPAKLSPTARQNAKLVIQTNSGMPATSAASNVLVGVRYTYVEASNVRANLRDVTLSGTQGVLVIGNTPSSQRRATASTQVTFADAKDSSLILSCSVAEYVVKVNSVTGSAAHGSDSVVFLGDVSESSARCTYQAPTTTGASTWTASHSSQACVGAQFIVNYQTVAKSGSTTSIKVEYTCEPEQQATQKASVTEEPQGKKQGDKAVKDTMVVVGALLLVVIIVVVVACGCFKCRSQDKKRHQDVVDAQHASTHGPIDILSRPSSAMSEDTVVVMGKWESANREYQYVLDDRDSTSSAKGRDLEIDDGFQVTIGGNEPLGLEKLQQVQQGKVLKMLEDEVVVDGERVSVRRSAPREGFSGSQGDSCQKADEGEEYLRRKSLTRSSNSSYGTADDSPRPQLTLNNDE